MSRAWSLGWVEEGTKRFEAAVAALTDAELAAPSGLPGWRRAHVVAHVARNADALVNLLEWARTGIETPMYASPGDREDGIERGAELPPAELRADLLATGRRFAERVAAMPPEAWQGTARTRQGRLIHGAEVLWMRAREVWVHQADLATGIGYDSFPGDYLIELIGDVTGSLASRPGVPPVRIEAGGRTWTIGAGELAVSGSPGAVAAWLTGRSDGGDLHADGSPPALPDWL